MFYWYSCENLVTAGVRFTQIIAFSLCIHWKTEYPFGLYSFILYLHLCHFPAKTDYNINNAEAKWDSNVLFTNIFGREVIYISVKIARVESDKSSRCHSSRHKQVSLSVFTTAVNQRRPELNQ